MEETRLVIAVVALAAVAAAAIGNYSSFEGQITPWYEPVVSQNEVRMALWANRDFPPNTMYAADLFACEMLVASSRAICSIGGAWELADNANQRFSDNERAFLTNSSSEAWGIFTKYHVQYVLSSSRQGFYAYGYKTASTAKFDNATYFGLVKQIGDANLYKVVQK